MKRRKFLQNTCPTVTFAFFGLTYIQACSKSDNMDSSYGYNSNSSISGTSSSNSQGAGQQTNTQGGNQQTDNGIVVSGNSVTLDLSNSTFSSLINPGNFVNLTSIGMLVLKISNSEFRAFDNCCPHSGSKDAWSYNNEQFKCNTHGNNFSVDGNNVRDCNSGATSGGLKRYITSLSGNTLSVTT